MSSMDPQKSKRSDAKSKSKAALDKLGIDLAALDLNEHEEMIASEVVAAEDIKVTFAGAFLLSFLTFPCPPSLQYHPSSLFPSLVSSRSFLLSLPPFPTPLLPGARLH